MQDITELVAELTKAHAQLEDNLGQSIIDWSTLEELCETSSTPESFQRLVDVAIRELQSYRDFPFRCVNGSFPT